MKYTVHKVPPSNPARDDTTWSVRDEQDNACGFSFVRQNAEKIAVALALLDSMQNDTHLIAWTCGHVAGAVCAQCHQELILKANELAAKANPDE